MAGCEGKGGSAPAQPALETVTYSNLTDADSRALLSVIFHDKFSDGENTLSVGHAGVLLPSEDGTLYFSRKGGVSRAVSAVKISEQDGAERLSDGKIRYRMRTGYHASFHHGKRCFAGRLPAESIGETGS